MKLGFVSAILPELSLEEVIEFAAEEGFDCVEVMCWPVGQAERRYAGVTHIDVARLDDDEIRRISDLVFGSGVQISGLGYYPNPLSPDAAEAQTAIEQIKRLILAAQALEVGVANTFIGRDWTQPLQENWELFKKVWPPLVRLAEDCDVRIGIENCPMLFTRDEWPGGKNMAISPAIWRRMFKEIPSQALGLNFDPSHMIWQRMDYLKPLREFAGRLVHLHAKDARLDPERLDEVGMLAMPPEYFTPKLPGLGDVDWGRFLSVLSDTGYEGAVCIEVEDRAYEGSLEARKASLRQSGRYLRQFMEGF